MARELKNTTASADSACRWGTYTVMYSFFSSTCQITEQGAGDLDTAHNKEATNNNSSADRCYPRQKISGATYLAVAEYNFAEHRSSPHGILARPSTASDEIKAAYGSCQSFKTCNSTNKLTVLTSLCENSLPGGLLILYFAY